MGRADDWPRALAAANRALRADPALLEARFNRALALEGLRLRDEARRAWTTEQLDKASEVGRRSHPPQAQSVATLFPRSEVLKQLDAAIVAGDGVSWPISSCANRTSRVHIEDDVLPLWAESWLAGNRAGASAQIDRAMFACRTLASVNDDRFSASTWLEEVRTTVASTPAAVSALAQAQLEYRDAPSRPLNSSAPPRGFKPYRDPCDPAGAPLSLASRLYDAIADYNRHRLAVAETKLAKVKTAVRPHPFKRILGHAELVTGLIHLNKGAYSAALEDLSRARRAYDSAKDVDGAVNSAITVAEILRLLGQTRESSAGYKLTR